MENLIGYLASGLIGVSLGLIGGGGSIITIPILVYLFHLEPTVATGYSLFIVGTTSLVGGIKSALNRMVDFRSGILLAVPSMLTIYLTRHYFLPSIPVTIGAIGSFVITKDLVIMIFFAFIMILAAIKMIRNTEEAENDNHVEPHNFFKIIFQGLGVGVVTGIVGAGGGFLIIPTLVLLVGLPMKKAVATSLIIIALNSLLGLMGDIGGNLKVDYSLMLILSGLAIVGIFIGGYFSKFIHGNKLKSGFGWFTLVIAFFIISKEVFF
jgi:hypothetical protein